MALEDLSGRVYGPVDIRIAQEKVAEYVTATGDDPHRWSKMAPPSYAGALLFSVAPLFIDSPEVGDNTRVLVHSDQRFAWHGPLEVGAPVSVEGTVSRVRQRGEMGFVTFECTVEANGSRHVESTSTFLLGVEPAAEPGPDMPEPEVFAGSLLEPTPPPIELVPGAPLGPMRRGASRLDLVRYAGASGDFNPIHFDHAAARQAGLDGVVVHGLLMAAWLCQLASSAVERPDPIAEMKLRFRSALRPAETASIEGTVRDVTTSGASLAMALRSNAHDLVTATATLRPEVTA